jgi:uridine phosphorylase
MHHVIPHHIAITAEHAAGNDGAGRVFLLPGSDGRARRIGERFLDTTVVGSDRQLNVSLGRLEVSGRSVDVGTVATGMGCPSVDIVVTELISLGVRRFIRVGTAGSLRPREVPAGSLVIATAAVRDEGASDRYVCPEYPAVADPAVIAALEEAARSSGHAARTFSGVVHSKDSLFARELGHGPRRELNHRYMAELEAIGVLATEMEAAHLFVLAKVHGPEPTPLTGLDRSTAVQAGAVLAIIGDDQPFAGDEVIAATENAAIEVALGAAARLV